MSTKSSPQSLLMVPVRPSNASAISSSTTLPVESTPAKWILCPITPLKSSRYDHVDSIAISSKKRSIFPSGRHKGQGLNNINEQVYELQRLPHNWEEHVHLDGKPYYRDKSRGIVTEVDIRQPNQLFELEGLYKQINEEWLKHPVSKEDGKYELYLTVVPEPSYYFVEHNTQDIFWLDDFDDEDLQMYGLVKGDEPGTTNYDLFITRNYYSHLENFPCHNDLPPDASNFLHGALTYTCTDHMTSRESATTPWSAQDAKVFVELLESLDVTYRRTGLFSKYRTWFVSRLLCIILHSRSVHRHGMIDARTDRLITVQHAPISKMDLVIGCISFFAHLTYVQRLENVWADGIVSFAGWQSLLKSLLIEWSDSNLLATVTLSANMAFLALSDLTPAAKTSSIVSTFFSIWSIVVGLHHVWRHRDKRDSNARQAGIYFMNAVKATGTLKPLAFFLCLPLVLLSWSLVAFACSISMYAFQNARPIISYVVSGSILSFVLMILGMTIYFFRNIFVIRSRTSSSSRESLRG